VTCTDMAVLCGNNTEACFPRYGSIPQRGENAHEFALRMLLYSIQSAANRYHRHMEPILSLSIDFYVRVFVRISTNRQEANRSASRTAMVFTCNGCRLFHLQTLGRVETRKADEKPQNESFRVVPCSLVEELTNPSCTNCGGRFSISGPIYSAPLHNESAVQKLIQSLDSKSDYLAAKERVKALLCNALDEVQDQPLFLHLPSMCKILRVTSPPHATIRGAIRSQGYRESASHITPDALKTDAPHRLCWDILRCWTTKQMEHQQPKKFKLSEDSVGSRILSKPPSLIQLKDIDWDAKQKSRGVLRFPKNPANWGPKARARSLNETETKSDAVEYAKRLKEAEDTDNPQG